MARQVECIGYPSQQAAVTALMAQGLTYSQIRDRTGLEGGRVSNLMTLARRSVAQGWDDERLARLRRIHAAAMTVIAEAFGVGADELAIVLAHDSFKQKIQPIAEPAMAGGDGASTGEVEPVVADPAPPLPEPPAPEAGVFRSGDGFVAEVDDAAIQAERDALAAEFPAAQRFTLRDLDGQVLHSHPRGLTRLSRFFWVGTAEQVAKLKRQHPKWAHLKPKAWT